MKTFFFGLAVAVILSTSTARAADRAALAHLEHRQRPGDEPAMPRPRPASELRGHGGVGQGFPDVRDLDAQPARGGRRGALAGDPPRASALSGRPLSRLNYRTARAGRSAAAGGRPDMVKAILYYENADGNKLGSAYPVDLAVHNIGCVSSPRRRGVVHPAFFADASLARIMHRGWRV